MATYYCDPVSSSTNSGTPNSFANRRYGISGVTGFGTAGDVIRIAASPDPQDMGQTATWTKQSIIVTLASAITQSLYLDGAWTAATNITASTDTTNKKEGTNCASLAVGSAFTTGKVGYYATGTLDLRAYNTISGWFRSSAAVTTPPLYIALCSDTTGDTPIDTARYVLSLSSLPLLANTWCAFTTDTPQNTTDTNTQWYPNNVKSIALYATSDPGTPTYLIDNIFVSAPASGSTPVSGPGLHIGSLIGPSASGPWFTIKSINGTTVTLDAHVNSLQGAGRGYWGPSGTFQLWKRETLPRVPGSLFPNNISYGSGNLAASLTYPTAATTVVTNYTGAAGSSGNPVTVSGGWSLASSMASQSGETWIRIGNGAGNFWGALTNRSFISLEKLYFVRGNAFATFGTSNDACVVTNCGVVSCTGSPAIGPVSGMDRFELRNCIAYNNQTIGIGTAANSVNQGLKVIGCKTYNNGGIGFSTAYGTSFAQGYAEISDLEAGNNGGVNGILIQNPCRVINNLKAYDNAVTATNAGIMLSVQDGNFFNLYSSGHSTTNSAGVYCGGFNPRIFNLTTIGNAAGILAGNSGAGNTVPYNGKITVNNWTTSDTAKIVYAPSVNPNFGTVVSSAEGGVATDNFIYSTYGTISTNTAVTHVGNFSWRFAPGSTTQATQYAPLSLSMGKFACKANQTITIKFWGRYSHATNIPSQFRIVGGIIPGVGSIGADIVTPLSGSADTWAQYTISATPTVDCVIEVLFESYISSGSGHFAYVDGLVEVT